VSVPFVDLKAQYLSIKPEIDAAIQHILDNTQFILGAEVAAFEEAFAAYCGSEFCIGVNNGTNALYLALLAADVGPGDEVVTTPFTFVASVAAIHYTGAKPVFVDIDPRTYLIDADRIEAAITPRTKALLPVHLYGQACDMDAIMAVARKHDLIVVEDACQAHGAEWKGRRVGGIGDLGAFSFYPGKNLGAYGEGGATTTSNPAYVRKIRMLRDWGAEQKYQHVLKGFNMRLEGMQGAILRVKLNYLDQWIEARRAAARRYEEIFAGTGVPTPFTDKNARHVFHIYSTRTRRRQEWQDALAAKGIQTGIHYPIPVHLLPAYADFGYKAGDFPHAEQASAEQLSLPMYPELTAEMQAKVAAAVIDLYEAKELVR
jgi:dTDP-4-amino-4,6-dideoxygalactose transaminase